MTVPLEQQIKEVQREIAMRERIYPRLTVRGTPSPAKALEQLEAMRAVLLTLRRYEEWTMEHGDVGAMGHPEMRKP